LFFLGSDTPKPATTNNESDLQVPNN
jgi:hypothetical protein